MSFNLAQNNNTHSLSALLINSWIKQLMKESAIYTLNSICRISPQGSLELLELSGQKTFLWGCIFQIGKSTIGELKNVLEKMQFPIFFSIGRSEEICLEKHRYLYSGSLRADKTINASIVWKIRDDVVGVILESMVSGVLEKEHVFTPLPMSMKMDFHWTSWQSFSFQKKGVVI